MGKKGRQGQKKLQGAKAKAAVKAKKAKFSKANANSKAKTRKTQNKAVKTNLKKMSFDNSKKISALDADITKVLMAPPKQGNKSASTPAARKPPAEDQEMPDVGGVASQLASL